MRVKTDQARAEQSLDDFRAPRPRQQAEHFVGRKRNVEEKTDGRSIPGNAPARDAATASGDSRGSHNTSSGRRIFASASAKSPFTRLYSCQCSSSKTGQRGEIMEQRPDGAIAETEVKTIHAVAGHEDGGSVIVGFAELPDRRLLSRTRRWNPAIRPTRTRRRGFCPRQSAGGNSTTR